MTKNKHTKEYKKDRTKKLDRKGAQIRYAKKQLQKPKWTGTTAWEKIWLKYRNELKDTYVAKMTRLGNSRNWNTKERNTITNQINRVTKRITNEKSLYEAKKTHKKRVERDLAFVAGKKDKVSNKEFEKIAYSVAVKLRGFQDGIIQAEKNLKLKKKVDTITIRRKIRYRENKVKDMFNEMHRLQIIMGRYGENSPKIIPHKKNFNKYSERLSEYKNEIVFLREKLPSGDPLDEMKRIYSGNGTPTQLEQLKKKHPEAGKVFNAWVTMWKNEEIIAKTPKHLRKKKNVVKPPKHLVKPPTTSTKRKYSLPPKPPSVIEVKFGNLLKTMKAEMKILGNKISNIKVVAGSGITTGDSEIDRSKQSTHAMPMSRGDVAQEKAEFRQHQKELKNLENNVDALNTKLKKKNLSPAELRTAMAGEMSSLFNSGKKILNNIETKIDEIDIAPLMYHEKVKFKEYVKLKKKKRFTETLKAQIKNTKRRNPDNNFMVDMDGDFILDKNEEKIKRPTMWEIWDEWEKKYDKTHRARIF